MLPCLRRYVLVPEKAGLVSSVGAPGQFTAGVYCLACRNLQCVLRIQAHVTHVAALSLLLKPAHNPKP